MKLFTLLIDENYVREDENKNSFGEAFPEYVGKIDKLDYKDKEVEEFAKQMNEYVFKVEEKRTYYSSRSRYDGENDWAYDDDDDEDDGPTTYTSTSYIEIPTRCYLIKDGKAVGTVVISLNSSPHSSGVGCTLVAFTFEYGKSVCVSGLHISSRDESAEISLVKRSELPEGVTVLNDGRFEH